MEAGQRPAGIPNLCLKNKGNIEKPPVQDFLQDLDSLPFPDQEMWDDWMSAPQSATHPVLLGRGCPFNCTYCSNHALKKIAGGYYVRFQSPQNIIEEIRARLNRNPGITTFYLEAESIGVKKEWALQLLSRLQAFNRDSDRSLIYGVNLRVTPNLQAEDLFAEFKKANVNIINIGLQSGSERVRKEILVNIHKRVTRLKS